MDVKTSECIVTCAAAPLGGKMHVGIRKSYPTK